MWQLRYTRNYVFFRTFNYEENARKKLKKYWKLIILQKKIQNLKYYEKNLKFWVKFKIYALYSLFEAEFYADVKTGFISDVRQNSGFWSEICNIFESYSYFSNILNKYITYFSPESVTITFSLEKSKVCKKNVRQMKKNPNFKFKKSTKIRVFNFFHFFFCKIIL